MKKIFLMLLATVLLCTGLMSCGKGDDTPTADTTAATEPEPQTTDTESTDSRTEVDIIMFMGDSGMAGRGSASSVTVAEGHAYEFKAVSDPTRLYPLGNDFGVAENKSGGIDDKNYKTGSMVPAFCEAYYSATGVPVIAVSASEGGTTVEQWQAGVGKLEDAVERLDAVKEFVENSAEFKTRNILMVWCQGEGNATGDMAKYKTRTENVVKAMTKRGVNTCFMIDSGNAPDGSDKHAALLEAQAALCSENDSIVMISGLSAIDADTNGKYPQSALDKVGANAGLNAASYVKSPSDYVMTPITSSSEGPSSGDVADEEDQYAGGGIELPRDEL